MNETMRDDFFVSIEKLSKQISSLSRALTPHAILVPRASDNNDEDRSISSNKLNDAAVEQQKVQGVRSTPSVKQPLPDPRIIRKIIRQRQIRSDFFASELFADPAWDMLLDLAAAKMEHKHVSVSSLCIASCAPPTTALRWIGVLIKQGLVNRVDDLVDRRQKIVGLTDEGLSALACYFEKLGPDVKGPI